MLWVTGAADAKDRWAQAVLFTVIGDRHAAAEALLQFTPDAAPAADVVELRSLLGMLRMLRTAPVQELSFMQGVLLFRLVVCVACCSTVLFCDHIMMQVSQKPRVLPINLEGSTRLDFEV